MTSHPNAPAVLLALDPSSTLTGYAIFRRGALAECGLLRPDRTADAANDRIAAMARDLFDVVRLERPDAIVVEDTSGKVARRLGKVGAGLAVYGKAVGYLLATARWSASGLPNPCEVATVLENDWTAGTPKVVRQRRVARMHPGLYDASADAGGDAADAVGLGEWWLRRRGPAEGGSQ